MYVLKVENTTNNVLTLTQRENDFQVLSVDGLNPPNAQVNRSTVAGLDGSKFNSSKLNERNLVITIKLNGDIEKNRLYLCSFFKPKMWCKIYYKNNSVDVYIEGYTENVEVSPFSNNEIMQISIICPAPYFKGLDTIIDDISKIVPLFEFPFSINEEEPIPISELQLNRISKITNDTDVECGVIIYCVFNRNAEKIEIRNTVTGETLILNYDFEKEDRLTINCNKGYKSITLIRNNVKYNLVPYLDISSKFLQLKPGDNYFSYLVDDGEKDEFVKVEFNRDNLYGGV